MPQSVVPVASLPVGTVFTGHQTGWRSGAGDDADYTLNDAWLAVYGDDVGVTFQGAGDQVSFNGPSTGNDTQTVVGSDGAIIAVHASVSVFGDNDIIYFDPSDDVLNLSAATAGAWSTLYASSGVANLYGAALNVVGGGVTLKAVSGDDAVSLYQTNGVADAITGDDMTVTLVDAQATVNGGGNKIWFVDGSASPVVLTVPAGQTDTVYGAGTIDLNGGAIVSVGGGALVNFDAAGCLAKLSYTEGVWDRVQGAPGTTVLKGAQAVITGGGQTVDFASGYDDNSATLAQTDGDWDSLYSVQYGFYTGLGRTDIISSQVNIFGDADDVYLSGNGTEVSLYALPGSQSNPVINGSNAILIVNANVDAEINGGGDKIFSTDPKGSSDINLGDSQGAWDNVYANKTNVFLSGAQASVFGDGNMIFCDDSDDAVSLYGTAATGDFVSGAGGVTLNDADVKLTGSNLYVYFSGGDDIADLSYDPNNEIFGSDSFPVHDTLVGFGAADSLVLNKAQFADFAAFTKAFQQQGDDAVLSYGDDPNYTVTFAHTNIASITASQVSFVVTPGQYYYPPYVD